MALLLAWLWLLLHDLAEAAVELVPHQEVQFPEGHRLGMQNLFQNDFNVINCLVSIRFQTEWNLPSAEEKLVAQKITLYFVWSNLSV